MLNDIREYTDRLRPIGVLYVDVYPFRLIDGRPEFLLLRRRSDIVLADRWQAVSGKIRSEERIADAFVRQVVKKTGSQPESIAKLSLVSTFYDEYYDTVMVVPSAAARMPADVSVELDPELHVEHCWAGRDEARSMLDHHGQHEALDIVAQAAADGSSSRFHLLDPGSFTGGAAAPAGG